MTAQLLSAFILAAAAVGAGAAARGSDAAAAGQGAAAPFEQPSSVSSPPLVLGPGSSTFEVTDGAFRTKKGRGWVHTDGQYTDFELEVEFRALTDKAEAAIAMRVPTLNDPAPTAGYFVTLPLPAGNPDATRIVTTRVADKPVFSAPAADSSAPADTGAGPPATLGQWQRLVVRVDHDRIALSVNGRPLPVVEARGPQTGYLGLESRRGTLEFRVFRVMKLAPPALCYSAAGPPVPVDQIDGFVQLFRPERKLTLGYRNPGLLRDVKPRYTADAMRSKVQGTVVVEALLQADGAIGWACVVKRLDSALDMEAVKAAREWRFVPATKDGAPVPCMVSIELTFTLK